MSASTTPLRLPSRILGVVASMLLVTAAGCASGTAAADYTGPDAPGSLPASAVATAPDGVVRGIYPFPQRAEYGDRLLPLEGARYVDAESPDFDELLASAGLDNGWPRLPLEGYALVVTADADGTVVLASARDEAGEEWARAALAQVTVMRDGRAYARSCRVLDWPGFRWRGNKRPRPWERGYRANFAWGREPGGGDVPWERVIHVAPRIPLDATTEGTKKVLARLHAEQDRGAKLFAIKFDDVGFRLNRPSELAFRRFPRALVVFVERVRSGLLERDPEARLFLLPQTYWWNDPRFGPFAEAVRRAGGLDPQIGLVLTGPEVISETIDAEGMLAARRAFGLYFFPALVYDNLGRAGDWGPLTGREPALRHQVDGIFGERGTPVHRLTRLDFSWNPEAYDPETSWSRALLELAGPEAYPALRAACQAFRDGVDRASAERAIDAFAAAPGADWDGPLTRAQLLEELRGDLLRLDRETGADSR